jgi:hypothetical protein
MNTLRGFSDNKEFTIQSFSCDNAHHCEFYHLFTGGFLHNGYQDSLPTKPMHVNEGTRMFEPTHYSHKV